MFSTGIVLGDFLKQPTPCLASKNAAITLTIPRVNPVTGLHVQILEHQEACEITKECLKDMLKNILISIENNPTDNVYPVLKSYGARKVADQLKVQPEAFWRKEWPFTMEMVKDVDPLQWCEGIALIPHGNVLAVRSLLY